MFRLLFLLMAAVPAFLPGRAWATAQSSEKLIVGRDTMCLFALPLEFADAAVLAKLGARLKEIDAPESTGCWRAYIGVWQLDDDGVLWLERVETMDGEQVFTGAELFSATAVGTRVRAGWFSGKIRYGTGRLVYYQHDGFMRSLEREWVTEFSKGRVVSTRGYRNQAYSCGVEPEKNARRLAVAYDAAYLDGLPDDLSFMVEFVADSTGTVSRIGKAYLSVCEKRDSGLLRLVEVQRIEDPENPLLKTALEQFRAVTCWNTWWIDGAWKEQWYSFPLRRNGAVWAPR